MSKKEDLIFIGHILESISAIEEFSKGMNKKELSSSRLKQSAITREIEIIGEAVKNISKNIKDKYNEVEWKKIAGTRDKMIHNYFGVDLDIVWSIIKEKIPELKKDILNIKQEHNK